MRRRSFRGLAIAFVCLLGAARVDAQTSGSINGTVTDSTGAVLPGVTVTATSPVQMGAQTSVTNAQGIYRFPSLTPGTYKVTYEMTGFTTVVREGIVVNLGFTATVNIQLTMASLQETVTVSGASPVVDVTSTTSTFNITQDMLSALPNARDIWSVMGQAPGIRVSTMDVGGSRAGTQTGFEAFGFSGQARVQVDGVNTTEGTGSAGFYYDYGSFDEIQLGADGMDASAATPGVQLNAVIKSGGNKLRGSFYSDYESESFQGKNIDARLKSLGIGQGSHIITYHDVNGDVGGPIRKDKLWYYMSLRRQDNTVTVTGFPVENPGTFGQLTSLQNGTYKLTYQLNQNNKIGHYLQYGRKLMPQRGASSTGYRWIVYEQDSGSWAGNLEWNSIVSPKFFFRVAGSSFGYNWPDLPYGPNGELNSNLDYRMTDNGSGTTFTKGSAAPDRNDRRRWQYNVDATRYQDGWLGGNHAIKFGVLSEKESQRFVDEGFVGAISLAFQSASGLANFTTPYRVTLRNTPRETSNANWHHGAYVTDNWQIANRVTASIGLRWDYYSSFFPDEQIPASRFRDFFYAGAPVQTSTGAYSLPRTTFADNGFKAPGVSGIRRYPALIAPRLGMSWDVLGNGKTLIKANWGRFHQNTGNASGTLNPLSSATATFDWIDRNSDKLFTMDELGQNRSVSGVGGVSSTLAKDLKDQYTDSMSVWFERQLANNVGFRAGYTFRTDGNIPQDVQLARLYSLYTLQRPFADPGPDGIAGNADDGQGFVWYDLPGQAPASLTETRTVDDILATDRAVDFTLTKRMSNRWSLVTSYYVNWDRDRGHPQTPNAERFNDETRTNWNVKMFATYQAPWGFNISPSLRHESGSAIGRFVQVSGGNIASGTTYEAEKTGTYRTDNDTLFDAHIEKRFRFANQRAVAAFVDAFNILNTNAANIGSQTTTVGRPTVTLEDGSRVQVQGFLRPTSILPPRVFRFGLKLNF
jgi:Carboxypeptidase regulatory-like domain